MWKLKIVLKQKSHHFINSNRRVRTFPRDSQRISERRRQLSLPISSHRAAKILEFKGWALVMLKVFTDSSKTVLSSLGIFFIASDSQWMQQWISFASGNTDFTRATTALHRTVTAWAPPVLSSFTKMTTWVTQRRALEDIRTCRMQII
jgi:hypothetical protein